MLKLGKTPARHGVVKLHFGTYANLSRLPTPPAQFGHDKPKPIAGMLGNATYGDCVWAGAAHETRIWNAAAGRTVDFTTNDVLSDYAAVTGFDRHDPNTDQGTDMKQAASYRLKTGVKDAHGVRHKIGAYVALEAGNLEQHLVAAYLFEAVGVGIRVTQAMMEQFDHGQPWDVVQGSAVDGGHYVPMIARRSGMFDFSTWATKQPMTDSAFREYNDESLCYVSQEMLTSGKSPEGFDLEHLLADQKALMS